MDKDTSVGTWDVNYMAACRYGRVGTGFPGEVISVDRVCNVCVCAEGLMALTYKDW